MNDSPVFQLFPLLSEELKRAVLSFVADAPLECLPSPTATLTHSLNYVNRQFHSICNTDQLWKECLERVVEKEPSLWKTALQEIVADSCPQEEECTTQSLLEAAKVKCNVSYKTLYKTIVNNHLRVASSPVFFMRGAVTLGEPYGLHFFEPRYRLLIANVMNDQPLSARNGDVIEKPAYFVHANQSSSQQQKSTARPAVLVQVIRCTIYPDGRADVLLLPVRYVWMERMWPQFANNLMYAQCLKMGQHDTNETHVAHRRSALACVMDRLVRTLTIGHLRNEDDIDENAMQVD